MRASARTFSDSDFPLDGFIFAFGVHRHGRHVASLRTRMGSPLGRLSISEQISEELLPDRLISGCSAALLGPTVDEQTKRTSHIVIAG